MYIIKRNSKRTVKAVFSTYERARQHVRKLMRPRVIERNARQPSVSMFDEGYKIVKVL